MPELKGMEWNAVDSVKHGIEHFVRAETEDEAKNYKYAILHVAQSVELVLKSRLWQEHPILIYNNLDSNLTDESSTVNFKQSIARLGNLGVRLKKQELKAVKDIRRIRNRIEHKDCFFKIQETRIILGEALKFIDGFAKKQLEIDIREELDRTTRAQLAHLIGFYDEQVMLAQKEAVGLKNKLTNQGLDAEIWACPVCLSDTVVIERGQCHGWGPNGEEDYVECDDILHTEHCAACDSNIFPITCNYCRHIFPGKEPQNDEKIYACESCIDESYRQMAEDTMYEERKEDWKLRGR